MVADSPCVSMCATFSTSRPICRELTASGTRLVIRIRKRAAKAMLWSTTLAQLSCLTHECIDSLHFVSLTAITSLDDSPKRKFLVH